MGNISVSARVARKSAVGQERVALLQTTKMREILITGLPKAAVGDHGRYIIGSMLSTVVAGLGDGDRFYTGLPLYHSSGQWFAMGAAVYGGMTG